MSVHSKLSIEIIHQWNTLTMLHAIVARWYFSGTYVYAEHSDVTATPTKKTQMHWTNRSKITVLRQRVSPRSRGRVQSPVHASFGGLEIERNLFWRRTAIWRSQRPWGNYGHEYLHKSFRIHTDRACCLFHPVRDAWVCKVIFCKTFSELHSHAFVETSLVWK